MKTTHLLTSAFTIGWLIATPTQADTFGSGADAFTIDFVPIGNAGNGDNPSSGIGVYSSPYGGVAYDFRMGVTEVPEDWINKATNLGMTGVTAGPWLGRQPATNMTWFEAAAFVNWLNTSTGHQAAYDLTRTGLAWAMNLWSSEQAWQAGGENLYRNRDTFYFLPSEDEWYKAAHHRNDGVTANYWNYAFGSNSAPTAVASGTGPGTAVFNQSFPAGPADVDNDGGLSPYGTQGQNGNAFEWNESASDGVNDSPFEDRTNRGGAWGNPEPYLRGSYRFSVTPSYATSVMGFRVASVPEPGTFGLLALSSLILAARRRRER